LVNIFRSKIKKCTDEEDADEQKRHDVFAIGCVHLIQIIEIDPTNNKGNEDNLKR
jgi:hypothetical protein